MTPAQHPAPNALRRLVARGLFATYGKGIALAGAAVLGVAVAGAVAVVTSRGGDPADSTDAPPTATQSPAPASSPSPTPTSNPTPTATFSLSPAATSSPSPTREPVLIADDNGVLTSIAGVKVEPLAAGERRPIGPGETLVISSPGCFACGATIQVGTLIATTAGGGRQLAPPNLGANHDDRLPDGWAIGDNGRLIYVTLCDGFCGGTEGNPVAGSTSELFRSGDAGATWTSAGALDVGTFERLVGIAGGQALLGAERREGGLVRQEFRLLPSDDPVALPPELRRAGPRAIGETFAWHEQDARGADVGWWRWSGDPAETPTRSLFPVEGRWQVIGFTHDGVILLGQPLVDYGYPYTYILDVADTGQLRRVFSWQGALYIRAQVGPSEFLTTVAVGPADLTIPALIDLATGALYEFVWLPSPPDGVEPSRAHPVYLSR